MGSISYAGHNWNHRLAADRIGIPHPAFSPYASDLARVPVYAEGVP